MNVMRLACWVGRLLALVGVIATPLGAQTLEPEQVVAWREDLVSFEQSLRKRHIDLFHQLPEPDFNNRVRQLRDRLPNISEVGILRELMCLTAAIGDGHTQVNYWGRTHRNLPLRWRWFEDGLRVVKTSSAYGHLLGARLRRIGGLTEMALSAALTGCLPSVENVHSARAAYARAASVAEVLAGAGVAVADAGVEVEVELASGKLVSLTLPWQHAGEDLAVAPSWETYGFQPISPAVPGLSTYLRSDTATAYLQFDHYPPYGEARAWAEALNASLAEHKVRRVIIDLRNNGGGDFFVGLVLAHGLVLLDQLDWRQGVYVLIGRHTYSAAMSNAAQYRQILNARLVGEPTGANPVGYQDADSFRLPNAGWQVMVSKRRYRFTDHATPGLQPDVPVAWPADAYFAGRDVPLEWILRDIDVWVHAAAENP